MQCTGRDVLVVDPGTALGQAIQQVLADSGYAVRPVLDGWAALLEILDGVPAAVVAGDQLPVMAGWELHHLLHSAEVYVPVVDTSPSGAAHASKTWHSPREYVSALPEPVAVLEALTRLVPPTPRCAFAGGSISV